MLIIEFSGFLSYLKNVYLGILYVRDQVGLYRNKRKSFCFQVVNIFEGRLIMYNIML